MYNIARFRPGYNDQGGLGNYKVLEEKLAFGCLQPSFAWRVQPLYRVKSEEVVLSEFVHLSL